MPVPFVVPPTTTTRLVIDKSEGFDEDHVIAEEFGPQNQHALQAEAFAHAICDQTEVPVPLEDSIKNAAVIEALLRSSLSESWEHVESSV